MSKRQQKDYESLQASLRLTLKKHNNADEKSKTRSTKSPSHSTAAHRSHRLNQALADMREVGINLKNVNQLRSTHIEKLVAHWVDQIKNEELAISTVKNKMTDLRWLADKIDKQNIVKRTNIEYGIENRQYVNNEINIAKTIDNTELSKISDENIKLSLQLQQEFGLRREEAIKFQPEYADKVDRIELKSSWTKGGRAREIPVLNERQRSLLNRIHEHCQKTGSKSLIPINKSYKQQLKTYVYQTSKADIRNNHGLRHNYAQERYKALTDRDSPKMGGLTYRQMNTVINQQDYEARMIISRELGHGREEVTAVYLGR